MRGIDTLPKSWYDVNSLVKRYDTLILEAQEQMCGKVPTHVFLQAGVGAMAGGIESYLLNRFRNNRPMITIDLPEIDDDMPCEI